MESHPTFQELQKSFLGPASNTHDIQGFFQQIISLGLNFKTQTQVKRDSKPIPATVSFSSIPEDGVRYDELLNSWQDIALSSSNWTSPNFMGFPDAGNAIAGLGAALLTPLLNQNMANQDICAPSATFVEMEVVHWLREQLGFTVPQKYTTVREIGGVLTLGGCLSNTIALMAAREHVFPGSGLHGLPVEPSLIRVLVPDVIEHYSIRSAMAWLSMGEANVVRIPVDDYFRMDVNALETTINNLRSKGYYILACVAYAGDSRSMRVDDLEKVGKCLREANVWFHVDACHGSQLAFSRKHRHKLRGISEVDSVTIDPHKVLWIPNTCSFVLFKDPACLARISTNSDLILKTQWSLGQITPCIGSKAFDALKLWSVIKYFGRSGVEQLVDERLALTSKIQKAIQESEDLVLLNDTDINSCVFIFLPKECQKGRISTTDLAKLNQCNLFIKTTINERGNSYMHGFRLNRCPHPLLPENSATYVLRTMNGNPLTEMTNVDSLLHTITSLGHQFMAEQGYRFFGRGFNLRELPVCQKLQSALARFLGPVRHSALVYGSATSQKNTILSDIDLVVFAEDDFCTPANKTELEKIVTELYTEERIALDAEVPYEKKLLVPLSAAHHAPSKVPYFDGPIPTIEKTTEYLASDEMLYRLVMNILTVPTLQISGETDFIAAARTACESALVQVIQRLSDYALVNADDFARAASSDSVRSGEEYLGYKDRLETQSYLRAIFERHHTNSGPVQKTNAMGGPASTDNSHLPASTTATSSTSELISDAPSKQSVTSEELSDDANRVDVLSDTPATGVESSPSCLLFLNGFPGVGKYTIAKTLTKQMPGSLLIDNHILIDPVEAILPGRNDAHYQLRKDIREVAFNAIKSSVEREKTVIMTSCSANIPNDIEVFAEHVDIARARKVPFVMVNITCDEAVNNARLVGVDRSHKGGSSKTKLTNTDVLTSLRQTFSLLRPSDVDDKVKDVTLRFLELDTTNMTPTAAANFISDFAKESLN